MSNIQIIEYQEFIKQIKSKVQQAQIKASIKVNIELLKFYWELGEEIVHKQKNSNWGSAFLKKLSQDLIDEFPDVKGFSHRNIKYIRQWYLFYSTNVEKGQQVVALLAQIPWGNNLHIITKCKDINEAIGVSEYQLSNVLPKELKSSLPTIEEIEAELSNEKRF